MRLIDIAGLVGVQGYLQPDEMDTLARLSINKDVLEVGSFKGLSSWAIALTAKELTCVDTFAAHDNGQTQMEDTVTLDEFRRAVSRYSNVKVYVGSSLKASENFPGAQTYDFIFIDAMHDYDNVRLDRDLWWPRLRPGGVMAFHDYQSGFPGVMRAVDESFGQPAPGSVVHTLRWVKKPT